MRPSEVLESFWIDPRIVLLERGEADADRRRAEQLGEGGRDRLDPGPLAREVHIGVDRIPHRREHPPLGQELVARHAQRLAEPQPRLDPALPGGRAVMVDDPLDPLAPDLDVGTVREDRRVLERDALLVVEAVRDPALQLFARELTRVHAHMERVEVVVAAPLRAQPGDELLGGPRTRPQAIARGHVALSPNAYRLYR